MDGHGGPLFPVLADDSFLGDVAHVTVCTPILGALSSCAADEATTESWFPAAGFGTIVSFPGLIRGGITACSIR